MRVLLPPAWITPVTRIGAHANRVVASDVVPRLHPSYRDHTLAQHPWPVAGDVDDARRRAPRGHAAIEHEIDRSVERADNLGGGRRRRRALGVGARRRHRPAERASESRATDAS